MLKHPSVSSKKEKQTGKKHTDKAHITQHAMKTIKIESMGMSMGTHCLGVKLSTLGISIFPKLLHLYENRHMNETCPLFHLWNKSQKKTGQFCTQ